MRQKRYHIGSGLERALVLALSAFVLFALTCFCAAVTPIFSLAARAAVLLLCAFADFAVICSCAAHFQCRGLPKSKLKPAKQSPRAKKRKAARRDIFFNEQAAYCNR